MEEELFALFIYLISMPFVILAVWISKRNSRKRKQSQEEFFIYRIRQNYPPALAEKVLTDLISEESAHMIMKNKISLKDAKFLHSLPECIEKAYFKYNWDITTAENVAAKKITLGMPLSAVRFLWGHGYKLTYRQDTYSNEEIASWYYSNNYNIKFRAIFRDGKLIEWEETNRGES